MGDVILVAPLFSLLREKYPEASLVFLTDTQYSGLFSDDQRISSVHGILKKDHLIPKQLSTENWDLVIDLQNSARSRSLQKQLRNAPVIRTFDKLHVQRLMLLVFRMNFYGSDTSVISRYIRTAGENAGDSSVSLKLHFRSKIPLRVEQMLQTDGVVRPAIALFPFSAWKNKEWPEECYISIGRYFLVKGWNVIIMGGPSERDRAAQMRALIGQRCITLAGELSLYECGCVLRECSLALGNDTGLTHLARACGLKTGIIYGPTTHHLGFFPVGEPAFKLFQIKLRCRPCHAHGGNVCLRFKKRACMRQIRVYDVIRGLLELSDAPG